MPYPDYIFSFKYDRNPEKTTGYSGPIVGFINKQQKVNMIKDTVDNRLLVRNSIERIIATGFEERVMRPNFGSRIRRLLFEPLDEFLLEDIKEDLRNILNEQEPRIYVENISFVPFPEILTINLTIDFKYTNNNISDKFEFVVDFSGNNTKKG